MARILAVRARAVAPADPEPELARARQAAANGDADWGEWVEEYANGRALILELHTAVVYASETGDVAEVSTKNRDVWVEAYAHPPKVAEQVRISATKDYAHFAAELRDRGIDISASALDHMYVEVTLDPSLVLELETIEPMLCDRPPRGRIGYLAW